MARDRLAGVAIGLVLLGCGGGTGGDGDGGPGDDGGGGDGGGGGDAGQPPVNQDSPLGTNLNGIADWSTELAFVDGFKMSRSWISGSSTQWDDGRSIDVDERGWVRSLQGDQIARTLLFWELDGRYPAGRYHVLYSGGGTLAYWAGATRDDALSTPGHDVLDVDPAAGGIGINITAVDSPDHLRDIRVIMPGGACADDPTVYCEQQGDCGDAECRLFVDHHATQVFHPTFLDRIETYRVLRFMDWGATNNSPVVSFDQRPLPDDARWSTAAGVPAEVMLDLAARIGADPWFCIPHQADDGYVSSLAALVADRLPAGARAYVEYSNEVWNGIFEQASYARTQGQAAGLSSDPYQAQLFFYSRRAVDIFTAWEAALGTDRLVRVMASQSASTWVSEQVLGFEDAATHVDALAIAPYFGGNLGSPDEQVRVSAMTVDQLMTELNEVSVPGAIADMEAQAAIAAASGVELIAYEAGQHLVGVAGVENDNTINGLFDAVNRDPRMGAAYTAYLDGWRAAGGHILAHFVNCGRWSKWGRWGALEWIAQPRAESPKYDALQTFIADHPRWW